MEPSEEDAWEDALVTFLVTALKRSKVQRRPSVAVLIGDLCARRIIPMPAGMIAFYLGTSESTLYRALRQDPELAASGEEFQDGRRRYKLFNFWTVQLIWTKKRLHLRA